MSLDSAPQYRRRTRWPVMMIIAVLVAAGIVVWSLVMKPAAAAEAGCNLPGAAPASSSSAVSGTTTAAARATTATKAAASASLGKFVTPQSLADVRPADPGTVPLQVLNASTVTGQAMTVTQQLRSAGFSDIGPQENDALYPQSDLGCYGEIRYGYAGLAAARTTLIVAPCAQLILDGRLDGSVDLSLGKLYQVQPITKAVQAELAAIKDAAAPPPVIEGQTVSVRSVPPIPPLPDRSHCPA